MVRDEVKRLIGPPLYHVFGLEGTKSPAGERWDYESIAALGGIRFYVEFEGPELVKVSSYSKYLWSERDTPLYWLDKNGHLESSQFRKHLTCP